MISASQQSEQKTPAENHLKCTSEDADMKQIKKKPMQGQPEDTNGDILQAY
jgi:hypothetical protein